MMVQLPEQHVNLSLTATGIIQNTSSSLEQHYGDS